MVTERRIAHKVKEEDNWCLTLEAEADEAGTAEVGDSQGARRHLVGDRGGEAEEAAEMGAWTQRACSKCKQLKRRSRSSTRSSPRRQARQVPGSKFAEEEEAEAQHQEGTELCRCKRWLSKKRPC